VRFAVRGRVGYGALTAERPGSRASRSTWWAAVGSASGRRSFTDPDGHTPHGLTHDHDGGYRPAPRWTGCFAARCSHRPTSTGSSNDTSRWCTAAGGTRSERTPTRSRTHEAPASSACDRAPVVGRSLRTAQGAKSQWTSPRLGWCFHYAPSPALSGVGGFECSL
jgi:hypothetical protein